MVALAPLLAFSLIGNGLALVDAGDDYSAEATDLRAMLTVLEREAGAPAVLGSSPLGAPAAEVKALLAEHGSPVRDDLRPSVVLPVYPDAIDRGRFMLVSYALVVTPVPGTLVAGSTVPPVTSTYLASATPVDGCLDVRTLGPDSQVSFPVVAGGGLRVGVDGWGDLGVYLAHDAETFQEAASRHQPVVGATVYEIATPDMGAGFTWRLNLKLGAGITAARICATK
jgi:hypothetical protein